MLEKRKKRSFEIFVRTFIQNVGRTWNIGLIEYQSFRNKTDLVLDCTLFNG